MLTAESVRSVPEDKADPEKAKHLRRYFKTEPSGYGENDVFIGVNVPDMRTLARKEYKNIPPEEIKKLLDSPIHEHRRTALFLLVEKYNAARRRAIGRSGKVSAEDEKEAMREKKRNCHALFGKSAGCQQPGPDGWVGFIYSRRVVFGNRARSGGR